MLMSTIFASFIMPLQIHPLTYGDWQPSQASMVEAVIATARIIGLPKMRSQNPVVYVHELQTPSLHRVHPRKAFIRELVK